jgi:membrane fusion protein, copper/silver efflux system
MRFLKFLLVAGLVAAAFGGGYLARGDRHDGGASGERRILYYVDPMHPAYTSDKPGIAPDCGMALEPVYADDNGPAASAADRPVLHYRDPDDHAFTSDKPGVSPETGNTLEPVYADDASAYPPGTVRIPAERQQLIGVTFATVESESSARTIRTVGTVAVDERRVAHVHPRFEGWIERVHADFVGQHVRRGQPLVSIYSPEMLASQQELLLARRARDVMKDNPLVSAAEQSDSLFEASKRRLELWGLSNAQIEQVLTTGQPIRSVTLFAPSSGFVTARNAFPTQRVMPDTELYTIVDLSRVWVFADVYESDLAAVRVGQPARVRPAYSEAPPLTARVDYIQPQVDPATRTVKVRLDMANPGTRLKPEMFVNAEFDTGSATRLTVPVDAVLDSGSEQTVFVDRGNGFLEPRRVQAGERVGDRIAILGGVVEGERVVASGTFLVDSESRLKSAAAGMGAPSGHAGHGSPAPETKAEPAPPKPAAKPPAKAGEHDHD